MRIRNSFSPLLLLLLLTTIATTQSSSAIAPEHGPSASGAGEFTFNFEQWEFSFDAAANKNGHARGRAVFDNLSSQTQVVVKINCLRVNSFEAVMTGTVLHSDDPDLPKSTEVVFAATDGLSFDTITPLFAFSFPDCNSAASPLTIFRLSGDAIQIQP
jgi:hypothetical protein